MSLLTSPRPSLGKRDIAFRKREIKGDFFPLQGNSDVSRYAAQERTSSPPHIEIEFDKAYL
jgi:hypothetical protein